MSPTLSQQRELPCTLKDKSHRGTEPESRDGSPANSATSSQCDPRQTFNFMGPQSPHPEKEEVGQDNIHVSSSFLLNLKKFKWRERLKTKVQKFSSSLGQEAGIAEAYMGKPHRNRTLPCPHQWGWHRAWQALDQQGV